MIELKARTARSIADEEEILELGADSPIQSAQVYLKSEADHYISELIADQQLELDDWYCKVQHHKYKRCLAMAKWCRRNRLHASVCGPVEKIDFWEKWRKRWRELAEKFKEAK